ncbi:MAG: hypothetical protein ACLVGA_13280 [Dysosmobacter sp.]
MEDESSKRVVLATSSVSGGRRLLSFRPQGDNVRRLERTRRNCLSRRRWYITFQKVIAGTDRAWMGQSTTST